MIFTIWDIYIYIYASPPTPPPPPRRTTARCRDSATNSPTFTFLVYDPGLALGFEVPRKQDMGIGSRLHSQFWRPVRQRILRKMIYPTMKVIPMFTSTVVYGTLSPNNINPNPALSLSFAFLSMVTVIFAPDSSPGAIPTET